MEITRRAALQISYENVDISEDLAPYLNNFSYSDFSSGKADDFQVTLEDRAGLWKNDWYPEKGAQLKASLLVQNFTKAKQVEYLPFGTFELDQLDGKGPPETITLKATSVPESASLRGEDKTRSWENTTLQTIAGDIASEAGLELYWDTDEDTEYDRQEQTEKSDLAFLQELCEDAGLSLKVTDQQIVIFDDLKYEQMDPVKTIKKGASDIINYNFSSKNRDVYSAARVEYQGGKGGGINYTYEPPNRPNTGKTLVINQRVTSIAKAEQLAKKKLRQKNKEEITIRITLLGDVSLLAGLTVTLQGWGKLDGKYFIQEATHAGPKYTVQVDLRRVLEGY